MDKQLTFPIPCYQLVWHLVPESFRIHLLACEVVGKDEQGYTLTHKKYLWGSDLSNTDKSYYDDVCNNEAAYRPINQGDVYFELATPLKRIHEFMESEEKYFQKKQDRIESLLETILRDVKESKTRITRVRTIKVPTMEDFIHGKV